MKREKLYFQSSLELEYFWETEILLISIVFERWGFLQTETRDADGSVWYPAELLNWFGSGTIPPNLNHYTSIKPNCFEPDLFRMKFRINWWKIGYTMIREPISNYFFFKKNIYIFFIFNIFTII